ncbi:hypothetical protein CHS0354_031328 [Potamilus streckersoni]|uniref:Uncharacterized protein n=1 Tax=Potamilus streckersoni TaxID=2493646 RepID=A0AAE0TCG5_9BIVA|nr:hypothetical protein CHS0354_031328 [Potamilus streckersoni]
MSWLKFWGKKSKSKDGKPDLKRTDSWNEEIPWQSEGEKDKNSRLRHTMSISRSGRFKQKSKTRSAIIDKPDLFQGTGSEKNFSEDTSSQSQSASTNRPKEQSWSPNSTCREQRHQQLPGMHFDSHKTSQATAL